MVRIADDVAIDLNALLDQQQAHLFAIELRQVAEETV